MRECSSAAKEPDKYLEEKTKTKEEEEKEALLEAGNKMGIETEGQRLSEIAQDLVKDTEKKEQTA